MVGFESLPASHGMKGHALGGGGKPANENESDQEFERPTDLGERLYTPQCEAELKTKAAINGVRSVIVCCLVMRQPIDG